MSFFAWPIAALAAFVFLVLLFRSRFGKLLDKVIGSFDRLRRAGPVEFEGSTSDAQRAIENAPTAGMPQLTHPLENIVLREREQAIRADLNVRVGVDVRLQIDRLISHLAATQLALTFESVGRLIWGSQLNLLVYASSRLSVPIEELRQFYDAAVAAHPDGLQGYGFERYLAFLINPDFLVRENGNLRMTPLGREFLAYLARTGATHPRAL